MNEEPENISIESHRKDSLRPNLCNRIAFDGAKPPGLGLALPRKQAILDIVNDLEWPKRLNDAKISRVIFFVFSVVG